MIATVNNMRRAAALYPGERIVMLGSDGDSYSATPGDYFMRAPDEVLTDSNGEPMTLAVYVPGFFSEIEDPDEEADS